jgi:hypothetical protein
MRGPKLLDHGDLALAGGYAKEGFDLARRGVVAKTGAVDVVEV